MVKLPDVFSFSNIEDTERLFKDAFYDESRLFDEQ